MLNEKLKNIRKEKNFTQDDVANYLNVKRQTYSAYERGVSTPDAITLNRLATFFGVSTDFLLGSTSKKHKTNVGDSVYNKLVDIGFINDGEEITDRHLEVLTKIIAPQIDYAKFQLDMAKLEERDNDI